MCMPESGFSVYPNGTHLGVGRQARPSYQDGGLLPVYMQTSVVNNLPDLIQFHALV